MIKANLNIIPPTVTAQQKGVRIIKSGGKHIPMFYDKKAVKVAKSLFMALLLPHKPDAPLEGPVHLLIKITFPWRRQENKRMRENDFLYHDKRPDLDNVEKLLIDCCTDAGFWCDDGQISVKQTVKQWGSQPGILIVANQAKEHWRGEG